jgi:hypothetical protein
MRKRLLIAALCMFALPLLASNISRQASIPINAAAMTGHLINGRNCDNPDCSCECNTPNCDCSVIVPPPNTPMVPPDPPAPPDAPPTGDLSVSLLFGALLVALLLRIAI